MEEREVAREGKNEIVNSQTDRYIIVRSMDKKVYTY